MKSLEQKVSRYRKLQEMIEELSDCLAPLKAEAETLSDEIFAAFSADKSLYNVGVYKTFAVGIIARELVRIDFSDKVTRKKGNERDQDWLILRCCLMFGWKWRSTRRRSVRTLRKTGSMKPN